MSIISEDVRKTAIRNLNKLGLAVEFSEHVEEVNEFNSSAVGSRINDLHTAFNNKNYDAVLTAIGGYTTNNLLNYIDYESIRKNPKILCGYSDITVLQNAILSKVDVVTYSGPHFSSFGMEKGLDYTLEYFKKCLFSSEPFEVKPSTTWSDDLWFVDQANRKFIKNKGYTIINSGEVIGRIIGGNLCVFNLLKGTEFMPSLKDSILFLEDDEDSQPHIFNRDLQSLIHLPDFDSVKGIVIGRFQKASKMTDTLLYKIIKTKKELDTIPIISNVDFGHTTPQITFPIGGTAKLTASVDNVKLEIIKHR